MAWFGQCTGNGGIIANGIVFFNIVFGSSLLFNVIAEDITKDLAAFNDSTNEPMEDEDRAELTERFCNIIQHYSDAKQ